MQPGMARTLFSIVNIFMLLFIFSGCQHPQEDTAEGKKPVQLEFDREFTGPEPLLFAPGTISTHRNERDFAISPDGKEVFYSYALPDYTVSTILTLKQQNAAWTSPAVALFSGAYNDLEPAFAPDGNKLYFISRRPLGENDSTNDWNIWQMERMNDKWGDPVALGTPVNTDGDEYYPSLARSGNLYFTAKDRGQNFGGEDIYCCEFKDGRYADPVNLGAGVNSSHPEFNAYVSPDEDYLLFSSYGREDGPGGGDLYIAFRDDEGNWQEARNLGKPINSDKLDYCPFVSPDGRRLFFTSQRLDRRSASHTRKTLDEVTGLEDGPGNGLGDIYWVSFNAEDWK
jgi:Tol biopolymer transport system component